MIGILCKEEHQTADPACGRIQAGGGVAPDDPERLVLGNGTAIDGLIGKRADAAGTHLVSGHIIDHEAVEFLHAWQGVGEAAVRAAAVIGVGRPVQQVAARVHICRKAEKLHHRGDR